MTPEQQEQVHALLGKGFGRHVIAREVGLGEREARTYIDKYRYGLKKKPAWWEQCDRIDTLTRLWKDGKTASEIAAEIGCTRNAVIGKAHRIGLAARAVRAPTLTREEAYRRKLERDRLRSLRRRRATVPRSIHKIHEPKKTRPGPLPNKRVHREPVAMPTSLGLTLMQLTDKTCKYADGDLYAKATTFCGNETVSLTRPYCEHHYQLVYRPYQCRAERQKELVLA